jgi:hypothetical protein
MSSKITFFVEDVEKSEVLVFRRRLRTGFPVSFGTQEPTLT